MRRSTRVTRRHLGWALAVVGLALAFVSTGGCYYMQAAGGHLELMRKREPIPEVMADQGVPADTRERLAMVLEARQFAIDELELPDNGSYRSYADLERDFVVWNVFAAPEFSLEAKTWCFPVVGCVAYRGYFDEEDARRFADRLEADAYDVFVAGVPAYSTLGRFDDPVLNTMMRWSDEQLISTVFHELAHQRLFIKGDTGFNESFATAVAEIGLERWLAERGETTRSAGPERREALRLTLMAFAEESKVRLDALYAESIDDDTKRARKAQILIELSDRATREAQARGFSNAGWLSTPPNNGRLVSVGLYRGYLDAFRRMLADCDGCGPYA